MRASHEWLRAFVPHALVPAGVEQLFSTHVATVDAVEALRADLAPIVVARVVAASRHPDSDHLWVTKVDDGTGEPLDVVCGASNVTVGTLYPFARVGTTLPTGITIEKRKIRGAISNGMLCSPDEIGLGTDHSGIMALDIDVPTGTKFLDAMPVGDVRYEIDVLPNRPDLLSHVGLARELSALTKVALKTPPELAGLKLPKKPKTAATSGTTAGVDVRIEDTVGCPRYLAFVIRGVKVAPSPEWLRDRLQSVGLRSISNIVDITNYFLHGYGQPMHAFDLAKLAGPAIVVRRARNGEKLATLDGVHRVLTSSMLVIADAERPVGIAGVIGGLASEVTDATTDVLLEVANFDPRTVRDSRRALGVNTDASHRFERGTDPEEVLNAGAFAAALIASLGGGVVDGTPVLVGSAAKPRAKVEVRPARVAKLIGAKVSASEITSRLKSIGFGVEKRGASALSVKPPSWRNDVSRDVDLIEEIARLRGYDTLADTVTPFRPSAAPDAELFTASARVRDALVAAGFAEVRPLPFVKGDDATHVRVTNPLADDEPHLRTSILDSLARRAEYNLSRREGNLRLFEIGSVFHPDGKSLREECHAAALLMGARRPVHFSEAEPPPFDAWDAKAVAESMIAAAGSGGAIESGEDPLLWTIRLGSDVIGVVRQVSLDAPPWASAAYGVELSIGRLPLAPVAEPGHNVHDRLPAGGDSRRPVRYRALPTTPSAEFDLAFIVPDTMAAARVEQMLRSSAGELLERVALFDEFRGTGIPPGHRSLAWRLTFRHPERTLNEKEIAGRRQKLISTVEKELGVVSRSS